MTNMISPIERPLDWQRPSSSAAVRNGQRQFLLRFVEFLQGRVLLALADNEAAADGEERGLCRISPSASETVNVIPLVCRGRMVSGRRTMSCTPYGSGTDPAELQGAGLGDRGQPVLHFLGQDLLGVEALQAEQDRGHGAVPVAGGGEGAVQVHPQRRHLCQRARGT